MVTKIKKIKKELRQSLFFSILLGGLIFVVIGFLAVSNWKISQRRADLNSRIETLREQIWALQTERQQLQAQIFQSSEQEYLEKEARETFNLKKPGEEVVTILPPEEEGEPEMAKGFWESILEKLKFW